MNSSKKKNILLISILSVAFLSIIGLTYAFFNAGVEGEGNEMVVHTTKLELRYTETASVSMPNALPGASITKLFSVENTSKEKTYYAIQFKDLVNEFLNEELVYKLYRNEELVVDITPVKELVILENIEIDATEKHEYKLVITFIETGSDQNHNQGKVFSGTINIIESIEKILLKEEILANNTVKAGTPNFAAISTDVDTGMYSMEDDDGDSYYFRGTKTLLNNNVIFANHQWKIIRINGDGSIRLIYNGICLDNACAINSTGTSTQIGTSLFNTTYDAAKYVGYTYDENTNSTIKEVVESWYLNNLIDYDKYIADEIYCNDSTSTSGEYGAFTRIFTKRSPNLKCAKGADKYTKSSSRGNGLLDQKVGLITADEVALAGGLLTRTPQVGGGILMGTSNFSYYLSNALGYWTMSPYSWDNISAYVFDVDLRGYPRHELSIYVSGVRPVISLSPNIQISGGNGSEESPYIISDSISETIDVIEPSDPVYLKEEILANNTVKTGTPNFSVVSTNADTGMYKMADDDGDSYYFRGTNTLLKNNVIFAEHQWKIIRINGDNSIRMIYNGACPNDSCTINSTGAATEIGLSPFNTTFNNAKYVGYTYDTNTNSAIKIAVETWYQNNLSSYDSYIADTIYCNDRSGTPSSYGADIRLSKSRTPSLKCPNAADKYTKSSAKGNGLLSQKVGLLIADEGAIAGGEFDTANTTYYLYTERYYWTMSPINDKGLFSPYPNGRLNAYTLQTSHGVRPVISLNANITISGGDGSIASPYIINTD